MLENFSRQAVKIIENAKAICGKLNHQVVGSEHLLLAMYLSNDTICHFLLNERLISYDDLITQLEMVTILRKTEDDLSESEIDDFKDLTYTKKFYDLIIKTQEFATKLGANFVYDEHLFYILLVDNDNVAKTILINLELDIDELIDDLQDIYNFEEETNLAPFSFLTNLSKTTKPHPFIPRDQQIERLLTILNKKQKNNPLLIGSAGVGKTAVVEGLSEVLTDDVIYRLDLGGVIAGTKYRGELEEKIIQAMDFIKKEKAILFIDEIHNIVGAGSNDGSLDIANILKPYLARSDIRLIGATTLDEYYQFIEKDKALLRRFQNVFIDEPSIEETKAILTKIKASYEQYHQLTFDDQHIDYIINLTQKYLPNRTFPDKAIDLLDEVGAYYKCYHPQKKTCYQIIDQMLFNMCAIKVKSKEDILNHQFNIKSLVPYYLSFITIDQNPNNLCLNNICSISIDQNFPIDLFKKDLEFVFSFKEEGYLEIDLENYYEPATLSGLIGTSKGYVGYESGGILSEHLIKYPFSVICFKNFSSSNQLIQSFLKKVINSPFFIDNKNRKINTSNTIFLVQGETILKKDLGLLAKVKTNDLAITKIKV